jgi:hypothetical protein
MNADATAAERYRRFRLDEYFRAVSAKVAKLRPRRL